MIIEKYLNNLEYYSSRGRGISVYNAHERLYDSLIENLEERNRHPFKIKVSDIISNKNLNPSDFNKFDSCIIYQNTNIRELLSIIERFINFIIFPFYYHKKPIFLISTIDKTEYSNSIQSGLLHTNYTEIVNLLLVEQLDSVIENTTYSFSSPEFLEVDTYNYLFTPIEQIMNDALIGNNITFTPQVRIGRFIVDFLVEIGNRKIIVECDGRDFHDFIADRERDKELSLQGYLILHFTGSDIYNNIDGCISKIQKIADGHRPITFAIDDNLDLSQKKAINHVTGPARVLAPAGSGKTKTLINRIVNLINNGIDPNKILALAFNKKAKDEMEKRLNDKQVTTSNRLSEDGVKIRTFHSFGYEIIRDHLHWQFPGSQEEKSITRQLLKKSIEPFYQIPHRRNKDPLDVFLDALRRTKMELPHVEEVTVEVDGQFVPFNNIFYRYIELQTQHNFFSFDDMIYLALRVILDDEVLRKSLQNQFEYILVDEFQDLNKAQILLMQILTLPQNNLFIVGDDDQMIYGWRGAELKHILKFNKRYSESEDFTLTTNYRSNKRIVYHSKWLIDHNINRVKKDIHPLPDKQPGVFDINLSESLWHQSVAIRDWIQTIKQIENFDWKDFAVLFRYNSFQFIIAMILDAAEIPHTPVNGQRLFQTNVGKDIFSYLRLILYPNECSKEDFDRILKRPNRSLSNKIIEQIISWDLFLNSPNMNGLQEWQKNKLENVVQTVILIQKKIHGEQITSSYQLVEVISSSFGFKEFYKDLTKQNIELDEANDNVLLEVIISAARTKPDIQDFFAHVYNSLFDENNEFNADDEINRNEVVLTTIHKTKGNEYSNVVYFNLESNNLLTAQSDIEEERRVTYVGVTRAIKNILITAPKKGYSNFLKELALNPDFKKISEIRLNNQLSQYKRQESVTQNKINRIEHKRKEILHKFPELKGNEYFTHQGLLKNIKSWVRQRLINKANRTVEKLERKKSEITEKKLLPTRDMIEKIQIEKANREILDVKYGYNTSY